MHLQTIPTSVLSDVQVCRDWRFEVRHLNILYYTRNLTIISYTCVHCLKPRTSQSSSNCLLFIDKTNDNNNLCMNTSQEFDLLTITDPAQKNHRKIKSLIILVNNFWKSSFSPLISKIHVYTYAICHTQNKFCNFMK